MRKHLLPSWLAPVVVALAQATVPAAAADPPGVIHYQGVLRNAADEPQDGTFAMVFRFHDDAAAGTEILCDSQTVTVTGGLFSTLLGAPSHVTACMGAGSEVPLTVALADHTDLWLQVEVAGQVLLPRIYVAAAPSALNARTLRGRDIVAAGPLELYVDAAMGSDSKDGLTPATAKATIQAAVDLIPAIVHDDVTVHVADGTYAETVTLQDRMAPQGGVITLRGNPTTPSAVVITGSGVRQRGLELNNVGDVVVDGFEIRDHTLWAVALIRSGSLQIDHLTLVDNALNLLVTRTFVEFDSVAVTGGATALLCQSGSRCLLSNLAVSGTYRGVISSRASYAEFDGPALFDVLDVACSATESGTVEMGQRSDIQVINAPTPLLADFHGRMLGYANAGIPGPGCSAYEYGICRP